MFSRAPSTDPRYSYGDFAPFSFEASSLAHPEYLHLPREFKRRDISNEDWSYFIESLAAEAFRYASSSRDSTSTLDSRDDPRLTFDVHQLLGAWNVGFFGPRSIKVFAARNGKRVFAQLGNPAERAGLSHHSQASSSVSSYSSDEDEYPRGHQSARERRYLQEQRRRRRRERREAERFRRGVDDIRGDWEIRFEWSEPLRFVPNAKPRTYGDKAVFERPKMTVPGMESGMVMY
jgi:hypothetical protein